jgi:hypothetical protein
MALRDLGQTIWQALQGLGQGVREMQMAQRYGPDWRERQEYENSLRDVTLRTKEYELEQARENDAIRRATNRAAALKGAAEIGALQLEGESDRIGDLPQETMGLDGFTVNMPSAGAMPNAPVIPEDVRAMFPEMDEAALANLVRGKHVEGKRSMKLLEQQIREALADKSQRGRLEQIEAQGQNRLENTQLAATLRATGAEADARADRRERERMEAEERRAARAADVRRAETKMAAERRKLRALADAEAAARKGGELRAGTEAEVELMRRKGEIQRAYEEELEAGGHTSAPAPPVEPVAPAPSPSPAVPQAGAPRLVRYQGRVVPFESLPPEAQQIVLKAMGAR